MFILVEQIERGCDSDVVLPLDLAWLYAQDVDVGVGK